MRGILILMTSKNIENKLWFIGSISQILSVFGVIYLLISDKILFFLFILFFAFLIQLYSLFFYIKNKVNINKYRILNIISGFIIIFGLFIASVTYIS